MFHFAVMQELEEHKSLELKEKIPIVVGERIRKARKKNKLSQTELALLLGKDRQYIYKIEKGKVTPSIFTVGSICFVLEISLSELFRGIRLV